MGIDVGLGNRRCLTGTNEETCLKTRSRARGIGRRGRGRAAPATRRRRRAARRRPARTAPRPSSAAERRRRARRQIGHGHTGAAGLVCQSVTGPTRRHYKRDSQSDTEKAARHRPAVPRPAKGNATATQGQKRNKTLAQQTSAGKIRRADAMMPSNADTAQKGTETRRGQCGQDEEGGLGKRRRRRRRRKR